MRVIIAGSRWLDSRFLVERALDASGFPISVVISGGARGVDRQAENWAVDNDVPLLIYHADWENLGKKAGVIRNLQMAQEGDALVAVWDGASRGTKDMISKAKKRGLKVFVLTVNIKEKHL